MIKLSPFKFYINPHDTQQPTLISEDPIYIPNKGLHLVSGPSGSGKSTLLGAIKGLYPHYMSGRLDGEFYYNDTLIDKNFVNTKFNELVYLFQNPFNQIIYSNPFLEMCFTAESQFIDYAEYLTEKTKFDEALEISDLYNKKTSQLSHGQAQKLLLASLLCSKPKVLLLDEPTAFMDKPARDRFYKTLQRLKQNYLILLVDHHIDEISDYVDSIITVSANGSVKHLTENLNDFFAAHAVQFNKKINPSTNEKINDPYKITLHNVSFFYEQNNLVLSHCNAVFQGPKIIVIRGKNGAGKSTLFKIIAGVLNPASGKVLHEHKERVIKSNNASDYVGLVLQNPEDNFIYDTAKEELQNTDPNLISKFFAQKDLNRSCYSLSEGEKRRLSFLANINLTKKVILYDEPTFGLDAINVSHTIDTILHLKSCGLMQIIISHDENLISAVADEVYDLTGGKLVKQ